jgi:hypothetical protein
MQPTLFEPFTPHQIARQEYILENSISVQAVDGFSPCWEWQLSRDPRGYGLSTGGTTSRLRECGKAYRASHLAFIGAIPDRFHVDHLCYNHSCVNPDHLEAVSQRENVQRAVAHHKALGTGSWNVLEVCGKGLHPMTDDNILIAFSRGRSHRACKTCQYARARAAHLANPERELRSRRTRQAKDRAKTVERQAARALAKLNPA